MLDTGALTTSSSFPPSVLEARTNVNAVVNWGQAWLDGGRTPTKESAPVDDHIVVPDVVLASLEELSELTKRYEKSFEYIVFLNSARESKKSAPAAGRKKLKSEKTDATISAFGKNGSEQALDAAIRRSLAKCLTVTKTLKQQPKVKFQPVVSVMEIENPLSMSLATSDGKAQHTLLAAKAV